MKVAEMGMVLLLVVGVVDLIGDIPEETLRTVMGVLELVAGIWFFMVWVPDFLSKFKADGSFRDFVVSLSITIGIMLCIGYAKGELLETEWVVMALMIMIFFAILLTKRLSVILIRKYGKEID